MKNTKKMSKTELLKKRAADREKREPVKEKDKSEVRRKKFKAAVKK